MNPSDVVQQLRALDDGVSRPVTIMERKVCGNAAELIERLEAMLREIKDQYLSPDQSSAIARAALNE